MFNEKMVGPNHCSVAEVIFRGVIYLNTLKEQDLLRQNKLQSH